MKFFYAVQVVAFLATIWYGHASLSYGSNPFTIMQLLVGWFILSCVVMILLKMVSIVNHVNLYNLRGYYGQFSVLVFMANEAFAIFSLLGILFFGHITRHDNEAAASKSIETDYVNVA